MKYLIKANNDLVSHCQCDLAFISAPGQVDCPWCGCGWLFTCINCRKAFTFAKVIEISDEELMMLAELDNAQFSSKPVTDDIIFEWKNYMQNILLNDLVNETNYVYLDGYVLPVTDRRVNLQGIYANHQLPYIPQVEALANTDIIPSLLCSEHYWRKNATEQS